MINPLDAGADLPHLPQLLRRRSKHSALAAGRLLPGLVVLSSPKNSSGSQSRFVSVL